MKKIILFLFLFPLFCQAQETYVEDGNTIVYRVVDDTSYSVVSYNGVAVSESDSRSIMMCYEDKKFKCWYERACRNLCTDNRACQLAWVAACTFSWFDWSWRAISVDKLSLVDQNSVENWCFLSVKKTLPQINVLNIIGLCRTK